jgi:hypothetical protein
MYIGDTILLAVTGKPTFKDGKLVDLPMEPLNSVKVTNLHTQSDEVFNVFRQLKNDSLSGNSKTQFAKGWYYAPIKEVVES